MVDGNTPLARPDPSTCVNESVILSLLKNKLWLNKRDGITLRHIVIDKLRIADNDILDNRYSGIWMQRVKKSANERTERTRHF